MHQPHRHPLGLRGTFLHDLLIVRAADLTELPLAEDGSVIEGDIAPEDFIGRTDRLANRDATTVTVDLEPGNYVFFCNVSLGVDNVHAALGMTLNVTVTD